MNLSFLGTKLMGKRNYNLRQINGREYFIEYDYRPDPRAVPAYGSINPDATSKGSIGNRSKGAEYKIFSPNLFRDWGVSL